MDKKNYRESLEKDRQEITTDTNTTLSRRAQRQSGKPKKEKSRNLLLPTLFFMFILIPVAILIFVAFVYEPDDTEIGSSSDNEVSVENSAPSEETTVLVPEKTEEEAVEVTEPEDETEPEEPAEQPAEETVEEEAPPAPEQPAQNTAPAPQENTAPAPAETPAPPANNDSANAKSVTVKPNETLYRIAVNNYGASGAGAAVEKIKQANGLTSNEIFVGQTLILP